MLKFGSKNDVTVVYRATIRLLDDAEIIHCDFQPQHKGKYILEHVCKQLNILETDYFGLRYVDSCRQRHWLDLAKTAIKQVKDMEPILFSFRVKFYPPDPLRLKEEITRYQIYQQLKRDLLHGRLYCSPGEAALLAACIVQSELGDYDPELHEGNYIAENKLLLKQTESIEEKALELHQTQLKGFSPEQAETHFLRLAAQLDTYAVDPHPVKDQKGTPLYLGINHHGILTFQGSRKTNHFRWPEVQKINYEGKMFIVHLTITEDMRTKKKHTVGFKCPTGSNCRHVWRCAIEQMLFFTLPRASDAPVMSGGSLFSWGTKFKYTGRTEREVLEEVGPLRKEEPPIQRCHSTGLRRKASSVPATPSTPSQDLCEIRYSSLPRSCHSAGLDGAGMGDIGSGGMPLSSPYCPDNTLPLLETVSEDQEIHARRNNVLQHDYEGSDYYFRDSFDHSSSESQLLDASGGTLTGSRSSIHQPVPKMQRLQNSKIGGGGGLIQKGGVSSSTSALGGPNSVLRHRHSHLGQHQQHMGQAMGASSTSASDAANKLMKRRAVKVVKLLVPALVLTVTVLLVVTIVVFETDSKLFEALRKTPEMVALRAQYYAPVKNFLKRKFGFF
ncbi:FERM domain-containing protein 5 isoform X2 [Trichogramma pretiosum]|uniref:FERM domain-containing protein 5 isoform X2 n=1 Tax=Trichogramma pretiosum TaxID=7493 RepID=UPI0006C99091|nr:FERM domain-containing protein 5 isoform X2 [Trichogramma pretiosum]